MDLCKVCGCVGVLCEVCVCVVVCVCDVCVCVCMCVCVGVCVVCLSANVQISAEAQNHAQSSVPIDSNMLRRLCGGRLGPPGPIGAHRPQMASRSLSGACLGPLDLVWSPQGPRWPPEGSVEAIWGLPALLGPTGPQVASRSFCGGHLGPPGPVGAHRAPDGIQKALRSIWHAHTHTDIHT